jgi:hypothetical protein
MKFAIKYYKNSPVWVFYSILDYDRECDIFLCAKSTFGSHDLNRRLEWVEDSNEINNLISNFNKVQSIRNQFNFYSQYSDELLT